MNTTPAYSYDPTSGMFMGETVADADPLVKNNWLYPAHSTAIAPPAAPAGQTAVFDQTDSTWSLAASWFASSLYLTADGSSYVLGSTVNGVTFSGLGALPSWLTDTPCPSPEYVWINGAWAVDPTLQANAQTAAAQAQCATLMAQASLITGGMSDAYIVGLLSASDQELYKQWAAYKLALTQISQQSGYPASITWPGQPTAESVAAAVAAAAAAAAGATAEAAAAPGATSATSTASTT
jgi:hypothetical protein